MYSFQISWGNTEENKCREDYRKKEKGRRSSSIIWEDQDEKLHRKKYNKKQNLLKILSVTLKA